MSFSASHYLEQFSTLHAVARAEHILACRLEHSEVTAMRAWLVSFTRSHELGELYSRFCGEFGVALDSSAVREMGQRFSSTLSALQQTAGSARAAADFPALFDAQVQIALLHAEHGDAGAALSALTKAGEASRQVPRLTALAVGYVKALSAHPLTSASLLSNAIDKATGSGEAQRPEATVLLKLARMYLHLHSAFSGGAVDVRELFSVGQTFLSVLPLLPKVSFAQVASDIGSAENAVLVALLSSIISSHVSDVEAILASADVQTALVSSPAIKGLATSFCEGNYGTMLEAYSTVQGYVLVDLYMSRGAATLKEELIRRAMKDYCQPYSTIPLIRISEALHLTEAVTRRQLEHLVVTGLIEASIDTERGTLEWRSTSLRPSATAQAKAMRSDTILALRRAGLGIVLSNK